MTFTDKRPHPVSESSVIAQLRRNSNRLTILDRAEKVAAIKRKGLSNRQLAKRLKVNEGTVRRLLRIHRLSSSEKAQIAKGMSAEKVLRWAKRREAEIKSSMAICAQRRDDQLVQAIADSVLRWLEQEDVSGPYAECVLREISCILYFRPASVFPSPVSLDNLESVIRNSRPDPIADLFWLEYYIQWGATWIGKLLPDAFLRDRVLDCCQRR